MSFSHESCSCLSNIDMKKTLILRHSWEIMLQNKSFHYGGKSRLHPVFVVYLPGFVSFRNAAFVRMPVLPGLVCASAVMLECVVPISMSHVHRGKDFCLRLQQRRLETAHSKHVCHGVAMYMLMS